MCTYAHGKDNKRLRNVAKHAQKAAGARRSGDSFVYKYLTTPKRYADTKRTEWSIFAQLARLRLNAFQIIYKNSVRTSQETHYISVTKTNRLILFGEIIAVNCEIHMEDINATCGQSAEY
jgi:hypothetical protein